MILIVDKTVGGRASALRAKLFSLGCPCAVAVPSDIGERAPFRLILTYADMLDEVRRLPYDDKYVVAIGGGFVNSALRAESAENEDEAIRRAHAILLRELGVCGEKLLAFGVVLPPALFLSQNYVEVYGNPVFLTPSESVLLSCLLGMSSASSPILAEQLARFCLADSEKASAAAVAVHLSHLNAKLSPLFGSRFVLSRDAGGYYSALSLTAP